MARCPLCRAALTSEPLCPRCGADLGLAQAVEAEASRYLREALIHFAYGDNCNAQACARQAVRCHKTPFTELVAHWLEASPGQTMPRHRAPSTRRP